MKPLETKSFQLGSKPSVTEIAKNFLPDPRGYRASDFLLSAQFPHIKLTQKWNIVIENQHICELENDLKALKMQEINQF